MLILFLFVGCQSSSEPSESRQLVQEPKTSFGKAVNKAVAAGSAVEDRDRKLREQAEGL